ncbi:helix-turn-helix transcriptional regulator [Streptomyces sp. NPDC047070]|uniref:helix-turn-helix transcriptional regulator n=1 Tax=Streptomyces sp. NPDC047070 TaxID=3154923 RepID=UPI0034541929
MARPAGNARLKAARVAAGFASQDALAEALQVAVRQVRRWESATPPWPQAEMGNRLTRLLGQDLEALGFSPPNRGAPDRGRRTVLAAGAAAVGLAAVPTQAVAALQPSSAAADFAAVTRAHRRLYWTVAPATLHPSVVTHATLGCSLLLETAGQTRREVAVALAESYLLAGRIEFFDIREPDQAGQTLLRGLQAAAEAEDTLIGAAILAHSAFIPGWEGRRDEAVERMTAARTYARRGPASAELLAWLDAVEAECETRCGNARTALHLIGHAEDVLTTGSEHVSPPWLDWFSPVRLAAFKGNTQLTAGHLPQARETLLAVLDALGPADEKQRAVVLGDLAAVEAAAGQPEQACAYAVQALDQLDRTWYAMGMDRVKEVRRALAPHQHEQCVRELDDRLYDWSTTVSALAR